MGLATILPYIGAMAVVSASVLVIAVLSALTSPRRENGDNSGG